MKEWKLMCLGRSDNSCEYEILPHFDNLSMSGTEWLLVPSADNRTANPGRTLYASLAPHYGWGVGVIALTLTPSTSDPSDDHLSLIVAQTRFGPASSFVCVTGASRHTCKQTVTLRVARKSLGIPMSTYRSTEKVKGRSAPQIRPVGAHKAEKPSAERSWSG